MNEHTTVDRRALDILDELGRIGGFALTREDSKWCLDYTLNGINRRFRDFYLIKCLDKAYQFTIDGHGPQSINADGTVL
jgi:vacuolar-type H+-ATPase subunit E/Vma4